MAVSENGHSSIVDIRLIIGGQAVQVAQVGEYSAILREPCEAPPGSNATVVITVDGDEFVYPVILHQGITRDATVVNFL